ncbi:pilus assembly PilX family protein [Noviherbaspirillum sp.]|uniref:pilus assembly PilX family protein n=1 Tax=Noviherbaspirillum sp. TaxID=1926288 RepID=UPI002FE26961
MKPLNQTHAKPTPVKYCAPQRGFSIVAAIFLLVVLSGLGAAMVRFSTIQHTSAAMDEQGMRAYQAARAGIEWGLHLSLNDTATSACFPEVSFNPPAPQLNEFRTTVTCQSVQYAGANPQIIVRRITSFACNRPTGGATGTCNGPAVGGQDYVRRDLQAVFQMSPR